MKQNNNFEEYLVNIIEIQYFAKFSAENNVDNCE